jgi:hypothetical protein
MCQLEVLHQINLQIAFKNWNAVPACLFMVCIRCFEILIFGPNLSEDNV